MRFTTATLLTLALLAPLQAARAADTPAPAASAASQPTAADQNRRIYLLQHRLVPAWTHRSSGVFFEDLRTGQGARFRAAAADSVSADYAAGIQLTPYPDMNGVLIEYPRPTVPPHCFYTFIRPQPGSDGKFQVYTFEKTMDFPGLPKAGGVVGSWSAEGSHANLGTRDYDSAAAFVDDLRQHVLKP